MTNYAPEPVVVRRGLDAIRHMKRLFFNEGEPTAHALVSFVMLDLHRANVSDARYQRSGSLYAVSSSVDWLEGSGRSVEDLFAELTVPTAPPTNSWRAEALLAAFGSGVFTTGRYGNFARELGEVDLAEEMALAAQQSARMLAWRFD